MPSDTMGTVHLTTNGMAGDLLTGEGKWKSRKVIDTADSEANAIQEGSSSQKTKRWTDANGSYHEKNSQETIRGGTVSSTITLSTNRTIYENVSFTNTVTVSADDCIFIGCTFTRKVTITGNRNVFRSCKIETTSNSDDKAISVTGTDNIIDGCRVTLINAPSGYVQAIYIDSTATRTRIVNNPYIYCEATSGNYAEAILCNGPTDVIISGNYTYAKRDTTLQSANSIRLVNCVRCTITGNTSFSDRGGNTAGYESYAINLQSSDYCTITGNICFCRGGDPAAVGIYADSGCDRLTITGNILRGTSVNIDSSATNSEVAHNAIDTTAW